MPAHVAEVEDAEKEGVQFTFLAAPVAVVGGDDGQVTGLRCQRMRLGQPDGSGRRRPEPVPGSEFVIDCDLVVAAIGMSPDAGPFEKLTPTTSGQRIRVDPRTMQTEVPYLFASGDVVTGATDIAHGRRPGTPRCLHDRPLAAGP